MPFESLSYRHRFSIGDFPSRWLPLFSLYDPDLPLFPISYFHVLIPNLDTGRPAYEDRVYGYIERMNLESSALDVYVLCNKNLDNNQTLASVIEARVREMLGLVNPVTLSDIRNAFSGPLAPANEFLVELWDRVVGRAYGGKLPFGRMWDPVFGLARWVASWYSQSGRKGELIQTHYFVSRFGERIQAAGGLPQNDFFLLPTFEEITAKSNPLNIFPAWKELFSGLASFAADHTLDKRVGTQTISGLLKPKGVKLSRKYIQQIAAESSEERAIIEVFNAFGKGPGRTVVFLLLLNDLREGRIVPGKLSPLDIGALYDEAKGSYQSSKVIALYSQQCFGNTSCIPIDNWVSTFFMYPLSLHQSKGRRTMPIMENSSNLGKVERLLWLAAQARKVHSSACNDAIWCTKYNSRKKPRGANPLACSICILTEKCPAFIYIASKPVVFNRKAPKDGFSIATSAGNNSGHGQSFFTASGKAKYGKVFDDFSPVDDLAHYNEFPIGNPEVPITVRQFVETYHRSTH